MNSGYPGQCAQCGAPILWTRSTVDPNRWNRPLDMASSVKRYVVIEGQNLYVDTYVNHTCSQVHFDNAPAAKPPKNYKLSHDEETKAFLSVKCPVADCAAEPGEKCINIRRFYAEGKRWDTEIHPHVSRRVAGLEANGLMDRSKTSRTDYTEMMGYEVQRLAAQRRDGERDKRSAAKAAALNDEIVAKTKCEHCGASRTTKCWDLGKRRLGIKEHTVVPHAERRRTYQARHARKKI